MSTLGNQIVFYHLRQYFNTDGPLGHGASQFRSQPRAASLHGQQMPQRISASRLFAPMPKSTMFHRQTHERSCSPLAGESSRGVRWCLHSTRHNMHLQNTALEHPNPIDNRRALPCGPQHLKTIAFSCINLHSWRWRGTSNQAKHATISQYIKIMLRSKRDVPSCFASHPAGQLINLTDEHEAQTRKRNNQDGF